MMDLMAPSLELRQSSPVSAAFFRSVFASRREESGSLSWAKTVLASNLGVLGVGSGVSRDLSLGSDRVESIIAT